MRRAGEAQGFVLRAFVTLAVMSTFVLVPARAAEPECVDAQPTAAAAAEMASRCHRRVEIVALRSENAQTFAKPGGGYTAEQSVEPRWAHKADGSWARIDTTLRVAGAKVAPVAAVLPVEFSAGGTGPAARLRDGDRELSITWPFGALPAPVLSGSDATYAEVLPGVDLKLTASAQGFAQILVVKNREAAKNPKIAKVRFGFATSGVTAHPAGGGLEAKDASGRVVFMSPTPLMWDSGGEGASGVSTKSAVTEPEKKRTATMPIAVENGEITVVPDAAMLSDAATRYPVMIDPPWTGRVADNAWTLVSSKDPGWTYWQGRNNQGQDYLANSGDRGNAGTGLTCDSVSLDNRCQSSTYKVRSYFRMDTSGVKGKIVNGASFRVEQRWAWTCNNGGSNATVRVTSEFGTGTTWNNQPGWWDNGWSASSAANRKVGSAHGCSGPGDVEFDFSGVVRHAAANNWGYISLVMHVDEGSVNYWKRFNASSAVLAIDYNTLPDAPVELSADLKPCTTSSFVPTVTPTLRARVNDQDGDTGLGARFEWARVREDGSYTPAAEVRDTSPWGSGTVAQTNIPAPPNLADGGVLDRSETLVATGDWDNDGHPDVIARDSGGYLYLFPGKATRLRARVLLGTGWNEYTVAGVADWDNDGKKDILARHDPTGDLYVYPGDGTRAAPTQQRSKIGAGFSGYVLAGVADFDKDTKQDLIARDSNGELWLYPGEGTRTPSTQARARIGIGFGPFTFYGIIDRTGDGAPDIIAEYDNQMWLYPGSGKRAPSTGIPNSYQIGAGWAGARALTIPDFNSDNAADIVAHLPGTTSWQLYPGVVGTGYGGQQWPVADVGLVDGGAYVFRVTARDWQNWGLASGWCGFSVDTTAPDAPTFSSTVYKTSGCAPEGCGSLGIADTFTFSSTSTDVVNYRWGFTDMPTETVKAGDTVRWTPPSAGPKTLFLEAVDRAGLSTRETFRFTVAGAKRNEAEWFAGDDPSFDGTGNGHDLTLTGLDPARAGRTVGGQLSVGFNGTTANGATTAKVVDTSKGFSVSAWVRLTNDTASRTVVSQQGSTTSAFRLGYDSVSHKWTFSLADNDSANAVQKTAISDAPAAQAVWTHLTGTYDDLSRDVRLYVDGTLQLKTEVLEPGKGFNAGGEVWVGKALRNSAAVEPWHGELAEVRAWSRTITQNESLELGDAKLSRRDVGWWKFNDGSGDTAVDSSPFGRDLTLNLAGGAKWGLAGPENVGGTSLELNGTSSSASTSAAVLNTDQSFSVDVWARVSSTGSPRTVVVQHGSSTVDPFVLKYDGAQWSAEMPNSSTNPTTWWRAKAAATAGTWTHLIAAYDASARTLKLSAGVQDTPVALKSTVTGVVGWNSTGVLSVGRSSAGEFFNGNIDDLRVWQGVLAPEALPGTSLKGSSISGDVYDEIISVDADGTVRAFRNVNGAYSESPQAIGSGWTPERTWFADIDGDGKSEIIGVDQAGAITAFKNVNGMNGFPFGGATVIGSAPGETTRIRFADIDGDGRADRVSIDPDGRVRVYRNLFGMNERGQSTAFSTTPVIVKVTTKTPDRIRFADIDGDGKAELITVNSDERQTLSAFHNLNGLGYGTYDLSQEIGSGWTPDRTWFADITGDGKAEIIAVRPDGTVWSWTNYNGLTGFPYAESAQIGTGWHEPARVFFG
ncbi:FG-GAP-like repeat-containing protein [Lentzea sp. NPDC051213]|uniref:FG-GAP-like repeat-containing protein n=1 Tax=Lentzea sp. NPDC051213 TaxID=3364126 RepID=UPI0037BE0212